MGSPDAPFVGLTLMGAAGGDAQLFDLALALEGAVAGPK
jgi:Asp-tRNA(Asn)/Glu-tRNA(Gln) amidotransferase A subunit family amidase